MGIYRGMNSVLANSIPSWKKLLRSTLKFPNVTSSVCDYSFSLKIFPQMSLIFPRFPT